MKHQSIYSILLLLVCAGCGSSEADDQWTKDRPKTYPVKGTVNFNGVPIEGATVIFTPKTPDPKAASAITDVKGEYALRTFKPGDGAVPGEHVVTITCIQMSKAPPGWDQDQKPFIPKETSMIPEKFGKPESSGLTATVKTEGTNQFKFDLK